MGRFKAHNGTESFRPDNGPNDLYIDATWGGSINFNDMLTQIQEYFGEHIKFEDLEITAEHIHTDCLGYDRYDSGDYTNYIHITKIR